MQFQVKKPCRERKDHVETPPPTQAPGARSSPQPCSAEGLVLFKNTRPLWSKLSPAFPEPLWRGKLACFAVCHELSLERSLLAHLPFSSPSRHVTQEKTIVQGGKLLRERERDRKRREKKKKKASFLAYQDLTSNYSRNTMSWWKKRCARPLPVCKIELWLMATQPCDPRKQKNSL